MGRALRIEFPGAFYHITSRGNQAQAIFLNDGDRRRFIKYLQDAIVKFAVHVHGYVLMTNHYHLIMETPKGNLARCMHFINLSYTNYINAKHKRIGHVLQGRYKAILVDKDSYLLNVGRYIHLNPVRAGMVSKPLQYPWSSYKYYLFNASSWVWTKDTLERFSRNRKEAIMLYKKFVEEDLAASSLNPFRELKGGVILGDENFVEKMLSKISDRKVSREIPAHHKLIKTPERQIILNRVADYFKIPQDNIFLPKRNNTARKIAMYLMYKCSECKLREIADTFGEISYHAVNKIVNRLDKKIKTDKVLSEAIGDLMNEMSNVEI